MQIELIRGWKPDGIYGIYRYEIELIQRLSNDVMFNIHEYTSTPKLVGRIIRKYFSPNPKKVTEISHSQAKGKQDTSREYPTIELLNNLGKTIDKFDRLRYFLMVKAKVHQDNVKHIIHQGFAHILELSKNSKKFERTVITCHDVYPYKIKKELTLFEKLDLKGLKKARAIITVSEFSKREIIELLGYSEENIWVIYNGVDFTKFAQIKDSSILEKTKIKYGIPRDIPTLLHVGSNEPRKNVETLLKALKVIKQKFKLENILLIKVGNLTLDGNTRKLITLTKELGLEKNVLFLNYIPEEDLPKIYNLSDVFVFPSTYEGFGLPPLEAMACGTPVIASNTSALPEIVGNAGILVNPYDVYGLAKKICQVLKYESLKRDLSKKGMKQARKFTWEKAVKETLKVYKEVGSS